MFGRRTPVHRRTTRSAQAKLTEGVKRACETGDSVLDLATSSERVRRTSHLRDGTATSLGDSHPALEGTGLPLELSLLGHGRVQPLVQMSRRRTLTVRREHSSRGDGTERSDRHVQRGEPRARRRRSLRLVAATSTAGVRRTHDDRCRRSVRRVTGKSRRRPSHVVLLTRNSGAVMRGADRGWFSCRAGRAGRGHRVHWRIR